jgi:hypothetical protein
MRKFLGANSMLPEHQITRTTPGLVENHQWRLECTTTQKFTVLASKKGIAHAFDNE